MHWAVLLGIAVVSDILDYFGAGIPLVGDILDVITVGILFPYIGIETSIGLVELVPGADFLPTYTALALWTIWKQYNQRGTLQGMDLPRKGKLFSRA